MPILEITVVASEIAALAHHSDRSLQGLVQVVLAFLAAVQQADESQKSWGFLARRSRDILVALLQSRTDTPGLSSQTDRLTAFFNTIQEYYTNEVQALHKVERVFRANKIRRRIEQFCRELSVLWQGVKLALNINSNDMLNEADLRQAVQHDDAQNQALIAQITTLLQQNNVAVLDQVDIRLNQQEWKIRQATDAIQNLLQEGDVTQRVVEKAVAPLLHMLQNQSSISRSMKHELWRIPAGSITNRSLEPIARGGFGEVFTATYYGSDVAVKQLLTSYHETEIAQFRREIEVWYKLSHSNVLPLRGACDTTERPFMVSPFMKNGTLKRYISDRQNPRSLDDRLRLVYEVASGMAYLHGNAIVHGDLKSLNVLLDGEYRAVISDFGMARTKHTSASSTARPDQSVGGTLDYMAPEMLDDENPSGSSKKTDVFAFGIMLYEVLKNGGYIWTSKDGQPLTQRAIERLVCNGRRPARFDGIPDQYWSLIEQCWHQDPTERPAFKDIMSILAAFKDVTPPQPPIGSPRTFSNLSQQMQGLSVDRSGSRSSYSPFRSNDVGVNLQNSGGYPRSPNLDHLSGTQRVVDHLQYSGSSSPDSRSSGYAGYATRVSAPPRQPEPSTLAQRLGTNFGVPRAVIMGIQRGDAESHITATRHISNGKPANDPAWKAAAELYQTAADKGNVEAAFELAWLHFTGIGVAKSDTEAFAYWQAVYQQASDAIMKPIATFMMAWCYYLGRGTRQDEVKGNKLLCESKTTEFGFAAITIPDYLASSLSEAAQRFFQLNLLGFDHDWLCKHMIARCYIGGFGTSKNEVGAVKILLELSAQGYCASQCVLGSCYQMGYCLPKDGTKAFEWYRKAADQGYAIGQINLGFCYYKGEAVAQDYTKAVECYTKAANQRNAWAQFSLGDCFYNGQGVAQDYAKAVEWWTKAASQGNADAQINLGGCYYNGQGVTQDYSKAVGWFTKAANQGHAVAQFSLGVRYYNGQGVAQNYAKAVEWWTKAASQGNAAAQCSLGSCFYDGQGVAQNYTKAVECYTRAANQGNAAAQCSLGIRYYKGEGVAQDYAKAVEWFTKAAIQGDANAQDWLGDCYRDGKGASKNTEAARSWYQKAAAQGNTNAQTSLNNLR